MRKRTFAIVLTVFVLLVAAAMVMRGSGGGTLTSLMRSLHGR
jgi:hypothetical protein